MKSFLRAATALLLCHVAWAQTAPAPASTTQAPVPQAPGLSAPQGKITPPAGAGPIDISQEPIVKIVANVQPAVVNINAEETVPQYYTVYNQYFQRYRGVRNRLAQSIGSGLIISADGFVITNAHVVALAEKEKQVYITLSSGSKYRAQIVSADDEADLALLKIEDQSQGTQYPYFDLTYVSPNLLGETVVALGSPAGYQNSVSHGILSALHRSFTVDDDQGNEHVYKDLIQTDAAINPGNSGGPLVDLNGGLVGINSAKLSGTAIENIGFAIPSDIVIPWATEAIAVAKGLKPPPVSPVVGKLDAIHKFLGIAARELTDAEIGSLRLQNGGLLITDVDQGSPADSAKLHKGMIIVMIGNRQITDEKSLPRELLDMQTGTNVRLQVIVVQNIGNFSIQHGGSVMLTAR
jgi:S1-C subfamily serine protease